ncbi:uncharacterized protein METZ01_LOCUS500313, partial [marine metagenome]
VTNASTIRCLVTAGPTREWLDPVRFLSNPSTGKMGYAIAQVACEYGWEVDLISGPVSLAVPAGVNRIFVETAEEMRTACRGRFSGCDLLVMAAAVCDHRPVSRAERKLKKNEVPATLQLETTPDI